MATHFTKNHLQSMVLRKILNTIDYIVLQSFKVTNIIDNELYEHKVNVSVKCIYLSSKCFC